MRLKNSSSVVVVIVLSISTIGLFAQTTGDSTRLLLPNQLFIRGVDNHANSGTAMVINLSNSVDLPQGTTFTLTDAEYTGTNGRNAWEHVDGGVSGITLKYEGQTPISSGSSICIVIPYVANGSAQDIQSIHINGAPSSQFSSTRTGIQDAQSGVTPNIKLNKSGFDHLYLMQSQWIESQDEFLAPGAVIDGFVSVPVGTNEETVPIPADMGDRKVVHQTPSLFYAFVICDDLLYFCNVVELLNGASNWTISSGSSANDLYSQGICERVCNFSDCTGGIEFQEIPLGDVCDYSICYGQFMSYGALVIEDLIVDGISLNEESGFSFPYCWVLEVQQGSWVCDYTGDNACPGNVLCVTDLIDDLSAWLILNDYVFEDIFVEFDRGMWCLTITQTDADFEIAFFGYEAYDIQWEETIYNPDGTAEEYIYDTVYIGELEFNTNVIEGNCINNLYKIVAVPHGCSDPEYEWANSSSEEDNIVLAGGSSYWVTVTCDNGCIYEEAGYIEVPETNGGSLTDGGDEVSERSTPERLQNTNLTLTIFPNPAIDKVFIEVNSEYSGEHHLTITSVNGAVFYTNKFQNEGRTSMMIDLKSIPAGIFLAKVTVGEDFKAEKFAVVK